MNVRFFTIQGGEDMLVDTLGMSLLFLPDLQYHFHGLDPNLIVNHAYNTALYLLINDNIKQSSVYCPVSVFKINNGLSSPHENIVFCNRRIPCISNGYCDSMRPFFSSTAISQAAAINS